MWRRQRGPRSKEKLSSSETIAGQKSGIAHRVAPASSRPSSCCKLYDLKPKPNQPLSCSERPNAEHETCTWLNSLP